MEPAPDTTWITMDNLNARPQRKGRGTSPGWFRKKRNAPLRGERYYPSWDEQPCDTWDGGYYKAHINSNAVGDGWHSVCLTCGERICFVGYDGHGDWLTEDFVIHEET
jgi:hypothetical protein